MITERLLRTSGRLAFTVTASTLILVLHAGGQPVRSALQFDRVALQTGEWYRLLTAHWVHADWTHAFMNVIGLGLLALIETERRSARHEFGASLLRCLVLSAATGFVLYQNHPELGWYLGLSGVLHGLFVIVLLRALLLQRDRLAALVLCILLGKLAWEHYDGALSQDMLSVPVIVAAHSYGALAGLGYALISVTRSYWTRTAPGEVT